MPYNLPERQCDICGRSYKPTSKKGKFCSYPCSHEASRRRILWDPRRDDRIRVCAFPGCWRSFWSVGSQRYCRTTTCQEQRFASSRHRVRSTQETREYQELELARLIREQEADASNSSIKPDWTVTSLDTITGEYGEPLDLMGGLGREEHDWLPWSCGLWKWQHGWAPDAWVEPFLDHLDRRREIDSYAEAQA